MILDGQKEIFDKILTVLNDSGMASHVMLVGSWVEYIYETVGYLEGYKSMMKTRDVDFLIRNLRRPPHRTDFIDRLEETGFILDANRNGGIHRFLHEDAGMEIEFLLQERGQGSSEAYHVESLGIRVQGLRNLDILSRFPMEAAYNGIDIVIPTPEAYAVHKLVINNGRAEAKREKDIQAIDLILEYVRGNQRTRFFKEVWNSLTKKQQVSALSTAKSNHIEIDDMN
jgi:hypothetical protein